MGLGTACEFLQWVLILANVYVLIKYFSERDVRVTKLEAKFKALEGHYRLHITLHENTTGYKAKVQGAESYAYFDKGVKYD